MSIKRQEKVPINICKCITLSTTSVSKDSNMTGEELVDAYIYGNSIIRHECTNSYYGFSWLCEPVYQFELCIIHQHTIVANQRQFLDSFIIIAIFNVANELNNKNPINNLICIMVFRINLFILLDILTIDLCNQLYESFKNFDVSTNYHILNKFTTIHHVSKIFFLVNFHLHLTTIHRENFTNLKNGVFLHYSRNWIIHNSI